MRCLDRRRAGRLIRRAVCALYRRPNAVAHEARGPVGVASTQNRVGGDPCLDGGWSRHRTRRSHDRHPPRM